MTKPVIAAAALALLAFAGLADANSFETTTAATPVPTNPNGSLTVRDCPTCPPKLVRLDDTSTFHVGYDEVSFAEFRRYLDTAGRRFLHVSYDTRTGIVQALHVSGRLAARPNRGTR